MPIISFREWLREGGGGYEILEGGNHAHDLRMRTAQSRQRARVRTAARKKVGCRAVRYELHYEDEEWYRNNCESIIDKLIDYVHEVWAKSNGDRVGPSPRVPDAQYGFTISVEDVPVMRGRAAGPRPNAKDQEEPAATEPDAGLGRAALPTSALPKALLRVKEEVEGPKRAIRAAFEAGLKDLVGWRGTPEQNEKAAQEASREAAECGLRFRYRLEGRYIPVSLAYRDRVFVLTADEPLKEGKKTGYVTSSTNWPELSVMHREPKAGRKRQRKVPVQKKASVET